MDWVRNCFLFFNVWNNLRRIGISSFWNAWWNSSVRLSGPRLFFVRRFLITDSIPYYKVLKFSLHDLALVGVFPFCLSYPVCWLTLAHNNSYNPFCFCWINNSVPTFISDFNNLLFSPFPLVHLTKSLSICWSFKKNYCPHFL